VRSTITIALEDADGIVDPVPTDGGGFLSEPELDHLSNIIREFNDLFGNVSWTDKDKIAQVIAEEIPNMVAANEAYQNAMRHSDKQNARIEHDHALQKVIIDLMQVQTELFKQFYDNPAFKKWLGDKVFAQTYVTTG
jgi:type I restriction enzyme, R subunit